MKKRDLEDWEKEECLALKAEIDAFNAGRPRRECLTQGKIADVLGINQGSVSSYLNGYNALNAKVASTIARLISKPVESFSPRLADEIAQMARFSFESNVEAGPPITSTPRRIDIVGTAQLGHEGTGPILIKQQAGLKHTQGMRMPMHCDSKETQWLQPFVAAG